MTDVLLPFSIITVFVVFAYLVTVKYSRSVVPRGEELGIVAIVLLVLFAVVWGITIIT